MCCKRCEKSLSLVTIKKPQNELIPNILWLGLGLGLWLRIVQGVPPVRSQFQTLITFAIFNVLTKFKHSVTQKGWEFFLI